MTKPTTPRQHFEAQLAELVDKFNRHHDRYLSPDYHETEVRVEFIDRFFEALGWDVYNTAGLGKYERDVAREVTEVSGRFDYQFQMQGRALFIVEAKAPHVARDRTDVIMQAKKYAWNSKGSSIVAVTDFEEFRLYDATSRPDPKHPEVGLIFAHKYTAYLHPTVLDDLWSLSREAVAAGSIDQLLKMSNVKQRERIPVDQAFLDDLTVWREKLAKAVYKIEPDIELADLNSVVQVFLDRLIFMRFAEDHGILPRRGLEDVARLWERSGKQRSIVNDLNALFHEVNYLLNGEIFKFHRCEKVDWDQEAALVAKIITGLYDGPYRFDVIGVELLGSIYERYLGKTIRVTATRAVVEDKPEARKAGGVYYTPRYIVDYIVDQTVGKLIEGKTPAQIARLKILDPACGSGAFLLGAYQKLLAYHERYHAEHRRSPRGAAPGQPRLMLDDTAEYEVKLPLEEKAAILRNNLYGVDLDPQAVEITMMSLYIKMLEGERGAILGHGILPPLRDNIKCGNSLIGHDIHGPGLFGQSLSSEELDRIKPFDWESKTEGFGEIMFAGGFDAVIGNPPYVKLHNIEKQSSTYYFSKYETAEKKCDLYAFFIERALTVMLRKHGVLGCIVSNTWLNLDSFTNLRRIISKDNYLLKIVTLDNPFANVSVAPVMLFVAKEKRPEYSFQVEHFDLIEQRIGGHKEISSQLLVPPAYIFDLTSTGESQSLLKRITNASTALADITNLQYGIMTADNDKFVLSQRQNKYCKPLLSGEDIQRYEIVWAENRFVDYRPEEMKKKNTARPGEPERFEQPEKIAFQRYSSTRLIAALDTAKFYTLGTTIICRSTSNYSNKFILGLVNSKLLSWWYGRSYTSPTNYIREFEQLPIRSIDFSAPQDKIRHDKMVSLVQRMLDLHKELQATKNDTTRTRLQREINITDEKIDALVYQLYGLTDEEIEIVAGTA